MKVDAGSGLTRGWKQYVACDRALATRPRLLIADEHMSMPDLRTRASVLRLLNGM
ncbi:MAG: hypothetical protein QM270_09760 [Bacillota bacterium]|nr:hypothetical protein [Bacillota bacterium]